MFRLTVFHAIMEVCNFVISLILSQFAEDIRLLELVLLPAPVMYLTVLFIIICIFFIYFSGAPPYRGRR